MKWKRKKKLDDFLVGFDGATLCSPFQCDVCWFYNLRKMAPDPLSQGDNKLLAYIRRVSLDVLWSRAPGTGKAAVAAFKKSVRIAEELRIEPDYPHPGPWPLGDQLGFNTALIMLSASQEEGHTDSSYVQFDSIRKLRTGVANCHEVSAKANHLHWTFKDLRGRAQHLSNCPTESRFFVKFSEGVLQRMGRDIRSNTALDHQILLVILKRMDTLTSVEATPGRKDLLTVVATYLVVCFCASLRGNEGFMMDLSPIREHLHCGIKDPDGLEHVVVCLLGRFKGETNTRWHMILLAAQTASGLNPRYWLEKLVASKAELGVTSGPAISDTEGVILPNSKIEEEFHTQLEWVQSHKPDLIPESINVRKAYGLFRSCRKGWVARAKNVNISESDTDSFNRWRKVERAKGLRPNLPMREHYAEIKLMKRALLRCSTPL